MDNRIVIVLDYEQRRIEPLLNGSIEGFLSEKNDVNAIIEGKNRYFNDIGYIRFRDNIITTDELNTIVISILEYKLYLHGLGIHDTFLIDEKCIYLLDMKLMKGINESLEKFDKICRELTRKRYYITIERSLIDTRLEEVFPIAKTKEYTSSKLVDIADIFDLFSSYGKPTKHESFILNPYNKKYKVINLDYCKYKNTESIKRGE